MKKILSYSIAFIILAIVIGVGIVYWSDLRGAGPAVLAPAFDIADELEQDTPSQPSDADSTDDLSDNRLAPYGELEYISQGPLELPRGFQIAVYADGLENPREIEFGPSGGLLVSEPDAGRIVRLVDADGDGKAEQIETVVDGLNRPHGFTYSCAAGPCTFFVGEQDSVLAYDWDATTNTVSNRREIASLPGGGRHWRKQLLIAPYEGEEKLFVKVASSCDVCYEEDERRGTIMMMDLDGENQEIFATGLRNAAFMTLHPVTGEIWVTEMGRDRLGDDLPPDEINIVREGQDYGWPVCYGNNIHDSVFDTNTYIQDPCTGKIPSYIDLQAHSAPLGLTFIPEEGWPEDWWYDLIVAYHGSWNRTIPTGYKLVKISLDAQGNFQGIDDFVFGWLEGNQSSGRPVDVLVTPGGIMYVTDDKANVVYKITRTAL